MNVYVHGHSCLGILVHDRDELKTKLIELLQNIKQFGLLYKLGSTLETQKEMQLTPVVQRADNAIHEKENKKEKKKKIKINVKRYVQSF